MCETWSPTLDEEPRLRVFENRLLRRMFGPKKVELTGQWRKLLNGDLSSVILVHNYSGDQIEKNEMSRACSIYVREERCIQGFGAET